MYIMSTHGTAYLSQRREGSYALVSPSGGLLAPFGAGADGDPSSLDSRINRSRIDCNARTSSSRPTCCFGKLKLKWNESVMYGSVARTKKGAVRPEKNQAR